MPLAMTGARPWRRPRCPQGGSRLAVGARVNVLYRVQKIFSMEASGGSTWPIVGTT